MIKVLYSVHTFIWGLPVLVLILYTGVFLSVKSGFAQIRLLPLAVKKLFQSLRKTQGQKKQITGFKALCTALAATVGTGNIAGVAGAIALGGPGVIFWMWICALFGMVIKLAEVILAIHFRVRNGADAYVGGPMFTITNGLPKHFHFLGWLFCFFGIFAACGVGNATQINAVTEGIREIAAYFSYDLKKIDLILIGIVIAIIVAFAFRGGASGIGNWAQALVPFASVLYILLSVGVLLFRIEKLPGAIFQIIAAAFEPQAFTGGVIGSMYLAVRIGVSRGVFTNEAGMGTAAIAHAAAEVDEPMEQGLMGIVEVFLDTIILCTLTALVILCSNVPVPYGSDPGIKLTIKAFSEVYGEWIGPLLTMLVCIFAFATILGWGLYGARCMQYIFGSRSWNAFVAVQCACIVISTVLKTSVVWTFAEIANGLMAIPNLISLILLSPVFLKFTDRYKKNAHCQRRAVRIHL